MSLNLPTAYKPPPTKRSRYLYRLWPALIFCLIAPRVAASALEWHNAAIAPDDSDIRWHDEGQGTRLIFQPFRKRPAILNQDGLIIPADINLSDEPVIEATKHEVLVIVINESQIQFESAASPTNTQSSDIPNQNTQQSQLDEDGTLIFSTLTIVPVTQVPLTPQLGFTLSSALWAADSTMVASGNGHIQIDLIDQNFHFSSGFILLDDSALTLEGGGLFGFDPHQLLTAKAKFQLLGLTNEDISADLHAVMNHGYPQGISGTLTPEQPLDLFKILSFTSYD